MNSRDVLNAYTGELVSLTMEDGSRKIGKILQAGAVQHPKPTPDDPDSICFLPVKDPKAYKDEDALKGKCEWIPAVTIKGVDKLD
jgi:hypothetical protein